MIKRASLNSSTTTTTNGTTRWAGLGLAAVVVFFSLSVDAATYYRWVDEAGVTHYTSTPPRGIPSEKVTSATRSPSPPAPDTAKTEDKESQATPSPQQQAASLKDPERCSEAKKRLETLQSGSRIRMATEDGGFRYLNKENIADETERAKQAADESC